MPSHMQTALDRVGTRLAAINGETVTYAQGVSSLAVTASPILLAAEEFMPGVAITRIEYQGWAIDVADLPDITPARGDTITRADGSVFKVQAMNEGEPPYRFTTSSRNRYLIHSERIAT